MNALWAGMMLMAIIYGTFHGTIPAVTQAALDSAKEAVSLCITMLGILSFWMGLMQVGSALPVFFGNAIAGPVILYGVFTSWILGLIYWVITL